MANSKKAVKKKAKQSDNKKLYILIGVVVILVAVYLIAEPLRLYIDNQTTPTIGLDKNAASDSAWARQRIGYARSQLESVTGLKVSSSWDNYCYLNNDNAPFDEAMNCVTGINATYSVTSQSQATTIESDIEYLVGSQKVFGAGFSGNVQDYGSYFIPPQNNLDCNWGFNPGAHDVVNGKSTSITVTISCQVDTADKIYSGSGS